MSTATNGRAAPTAMAATSPTRAWSVHDASELYEVSRWGNGYFSVNTSGHLEVHPTKDPQRAIDLKQLIDRLQFRAEAFNAFNNVNYTKVSLDAASPNSFGVFTDAAPARVMQFALRYEW